MMALKGAGYQAWKNRVVEDVPYTGSTKERSLVAGVEYDELEEPVLMYPFHRPSETVRELSLHDEHKGGRGLSKSQPSSLSDKSSG